MGREREEPTITTQRNGVVNKKERENVPLRGLPVGPQSLPVSETRCHDMLATGHVQKLAYAPVLSPPSQTCGKERHQYSPI